MSNFALVVIIAQSTSAHEFGAFAIAYSLTVVWLVAARAAIGETLTVTISGSGDARCALGAAVGLGIAAGMTCAFAATVLPVGPLRPWLLSFAAGIPLLMFQDVGRYVGFASQTPRIATVSDGLWLGVQILLWGALWVGGLADGIWLLTSWWVAAGIAALASVAATGTPTLRSGLSWIGQRRRLALSFAGESILATGANQTAVYAVGIVAGLPAAGALRATQTLLAPLRAVSSGIEAVALPEARARLRDAGPGGLRSFQYRVVAGLVPLGAVTVLILIFLPERVGELVLNEVWAQAAQVVAPVGLGFVAGMVLTGARLGLRSLHASGIVVRLYAVGAMVIITLGVGGAIAAGLRGAAWGLAVAQVTVASMAWRHVLRLDGSDGLEAR